MEYMEWSRSCWTTVRNTSILTYLQYFVLQIAFPWLQRGLTEGDDKPMKEGFALNFGCW